MPELPTFGPQDEETVKLKIKFSEMAQGKLIAPFIIAHIESAIILATQKSAPREMKGALIAILIEAIEILTNIN
jgi:hypothetical protein